MSAFSRRTRLADICRERLNAGSTVKPLINPARVFPAAIYRDRLFGPPGRMRQPWGSLAILVRSDAATAVSGADARVDYGGDVGALNFGGGAEHDTRSGLGLGRQPLQHRGDKSRLLVGGHRSGQSCTMSRFASSRRMGISGGPPSIKPHRAGKKYLFRRSRKGGRPCEVGALGVGSPPMPDQFWTCAQTLGGRETYAAERLTDAGFSVFAPKIETRRAIEPLFRGYVFALVVEGHWLAINRTFGVIWRHPLR
jgi:hypothetical protein